MTVDNNKIILQNTLGILLGFDDGAEDVLDHLLTIESGDDLSEYLDQLLGSNRPDVAEFVENVNRYQRGEPLKLIGDDNNNHNHNHNNTAFQEDSKPKASESQQNNNIIINNNNIQKQQSKKSRVPPPKKTTTKSPQIITNHNKVQNQQLAASISTHSNIQNNRQSENQQQQQQQQQKQQPIIIKKSHPSKGKANTICGCFGTKHKPLTNCLYCGRISCELEGYDYCSFCGYMVDEAGIEGSNDKARIQKDRLLRFDRDFARRTEIIDDQSDYQMPTTWMTEEEREDAEDNQKKQLELLKRPKQTLNIGF